MVPKPFEFCIREWTIINSQKCRLEHYKSRLTANNLKRNSILEMYCRFNDQLFMLFLKKYHQEDTFRC